MPKDKTYRYVLLYSDFYDDDRNWYLGKNLITTQVSRSSLFFNYFLVIKSYYFQYFEDLKCPETKCTITSNRTYLSSIRDFDALLFFAHNKGDMKEYPRPSDRRAEQIYIVSMLETPPHTWRTFEKDHQYFNWTMSYRFESDVFWPYGYFVDSATENVITPSMQPIWRQLDDDHYNRPFFRNASLHNLISGKRKMAAWFVSNCNLTPSKRMKVAKDMRNFIDVDIFGACGELSCSKKNHQQCQKMLEDDYKFYLSFENSLCQDYITEKVFSNMNYFIIPVVYNAADNARFLPPGSYINVLDYSSIKELTDYMWYLALHPDEYMKYFWWKEFYYIRSGYNFCDLCVKIHEKGLKQRRQNYNDVDIWYRDDACIQTPTIPLLPEMTEKDDS